MLETRMITEFYRNLWKPSLSCVCPTCLPITLVALDWDAAIFRPRRLRAFSEVKGKQKLRGKFGEKKSNRINAGSQIAPNRQDKFGEQTSLSVGLGLGHKKRIAPPAAHRLATIIRRIFSPNQKPVFTV